MRFTWIALPIVLVALQGAGAASDAAPAGDERDRHPGGKDFAAAPAASATSAPVVAMHSASGETQMLRLFPPVKIRRNQPLGVDPPGTRRAHQARVRIRTVDRAGLAYIPEINRATTGFFSSSTTACPPPYSL